MLQPLLLKEDGATFHASIEQLDDGQVRASCYAQLDSKNSLTQEMPLTAIFANERKAKDWVGHQVAIRKFDKVYAG